MTVCQGCGKGCNSDLCCPTCGSLNRSSFFCSQECFSSNWKEHCKLHAIIKQQIRMAELDDRERRVRGISAASNAFSAIAEMLRAPPTPERVLSVEGSLKKNSDMPETFKDHQVRPLDRIIGPNGILKGFRIFLLLTAVIVIVFFKVNTLLSEIPNAVEKRAVIKVTEALGVQTAGAASNSAVLVSPSVSNEKRDDPSSGLRSEIERLRKQVEQYKGLYESAIHAKNSTKDHQPVLNEVVDQLQKQQEPFPTGVVNNPVGVLQDPIGVVDDPVGIVNNEPVVVLEDPIANDSVGVVRIESAESAQARGLRQIGVVGAK